MVKATTAQEIDTLHIFKLRCCFCFHPDGFWDVVWFEVPNVGYFKMFISLVSWALYEPDFFVNQWSCFCLMYSENTFACFQQISFVGFPNPVTVGKSIHFLWKEPYWPSRSTATLCRAGRKIQSSSSGGPPMCLQGAGQLEIHGRQYRLVLEGSLAHLRGLGNDWISPFFMETNEGGGWVGAC